MIKDNIQEAILLLIDNSHKQKHISDVLDVSLNTIRTVVTKNSVQYKGLETRKSNCKDKILDLYSKGLNKMEICETLDINSKKVSEILIEENIFMDKETVTNKVVTLYKEGYNSTSIANYLRISYKTVVKILKENSLDIETNIYSDKKLPDRSKNNILSMFDKHINISDIAQELDLNELIVIHDINQEKGY